MRKPLFSLFFLVAAVASRPAAERLPAFPGAEGFGAFTPGGRGGQVCVVSNLNDSGPGSLRAAVEADGPRIVVFRVAGNIGLKSPLRLRKPFLTVAGQSAPGDGVCLSNYSCVIDTHDVVLRHLRFRPGDTAGKELDALSISGGHNILVDHCSASWSIDETLSVNGDDVRDITVQWCLIAESLRQSLHHKGPHGYGSLIVGADGGVSFHHNAYVHHDSRNPRPGGRAGAPGIILDFRNNLIYNWGSRAGYTAETAVRLNYVGNYLKPGPSTRPSSRNVAFLFGAPATKMFVADNVLEGFAEGTRDNRLLLRPGKEMTTEQLAASLVTEPFPAAPVAKESAALACARILEDVGATLPRRDAADRRLIEEIKTGRGRIINSQAEVGGWPELRTAEPPADTDLDGMPDDWERQHHFDPRDAADAAQDADGDGYTNVEEFLNDTAPREEHRSLRK
jgi:pectate lyase